MTLPINCSIRLLLQVEQVTEALSWSFKLNEIVATFWQSKQMYSYLGMSATSTSAF